MLLIGARHCLHLKKHIMIYVFGGGGEGRRGGGGGGGGGRRCMYIHTNL